MQIGYTLLEPLHRLVRSRRFRRWLLQRIGPPASHRIVLHLGPHKTGTTSIQFFIEHNRFRLPLTHDVVRRAEPVLAKLASHLRALDNSKDVEATLLEIRDLASGLAARCRMAPVTLISHEDLLGVLPSRNRMPGLYELAPLYLPELLAGLASHGARLDLVFYLRPWSEWKASVYRQKHHGGEELTYDPEAFARDYHLPEGWDACIERLRQAATPHGFHLMSFEEDRKDGFIGLQLLRLLGLSPRQIGRLCRTPPQNVRHPGTLRAIRD